MHLVMIGCDTPADDPGQQNLQWIRPPWASPGELARPFRIPFVDPMP